MKKVIEYDAYCGSCGGTGLYVGFGEHDKAAILCRNCNGTGCFHARHVYTPFVKRKNKRGVRRVFRYNPGIGIGEKQGLCTLESFGGISFEDWAKGKGFPAGSEMRLYVCPAWWYQGVDYKKKPEWKACIGCGSFSECTSFKNKDKCWERWDVEFGKGEKRG